jgi:hypothetical protein
MIQRLTFILSLMFAAVAAAGLFGRHRIRPSGKDTAAKEVASAEAAAPTAPILSAPLAPTAAASQAPAAPAAPEPPARMTAAQEAGFDALRNSLKSRAEDRIQALSRYDPYARGPLNGRRCCLRLERRIGRGMDELGRLRQRSVRPEGETHPRDIGV